MQEARYILFPCSPSQSNITFILLLAVVSSLPHSTSHVFSPYKQGDLSRCFAEIVYLPQSAHSNQTPTPQNPKASKNSYILQRH